MVKLIIEPKKTKDGQIDYIVTSHDVKTDNQFTVTTTNDLSEAVQRLKEYPGKRDKGPYLEINRKTRFFFNFIKTTWTRRDLNPRPLRCERSDLPLIYGCPVWYYNSPADGI